jgi:hypothetical protein
MKPDAKSHYEVVAELVLPKFDEERLSVRLERQFVAGQLEQAARRGAWAELLHWLDRAPTAKEWHKYDHALAHYVQQLAHYEQEVADGLLPLKLLVHYDGMVTDRQIQVEMTAMDGRIRPGRKKPKRPKRIDRDPSRHWLSPALLAGGFWRSGIKVTSHRVKASFSRLRPGESAYILNKTVHVQMTEQTQLKWKISSRLQPEPIHGEIAAP